jgi:hypothetical protein
MSPGYFCSVTTACAFFLLSGLLGNLQAASFTVSTVEDLRAALVAAESNTEDNTITVAAGTYSLTSSLTYNSTTIRALTIRAAGNDEVILDTGGWDRIFYILAKGDVTLENLTCTNGYVPEESNGAGLFIKVNSGNLTLDAITIRDCFAGAFYFSNSGAGAYLNLGLGVNLLMRNCIISGNIAKGHGGGLYLSLIDGAATLVNNTVVDNLNKASVVEHGGGIYARLYFDAASIALYNNIFWGNSFAHGDNDLYVEDDGDGSGNGGAVLLRNNTIAAFAYNSESTSFVTLADNQSQDPLLSATHTIGVDSPCVDQGLATAPNLPAFDRSGTPRSLDGDCDGNAFPDMGAEEYQLLPTLQTTQATGITSSSAVSGGSVTSEGGHGVTGKGVCFAVAPLPSVGDASCSDEGTGSSPFVSTLNGLTEGETYYYRAYATTCEGTAYGEEFDFRPSRYPTVRTSAPSSITATKAQGGGVVAGEGDAAVTARGVCWGTAPNPDLSGACTHDGGGPGPFSSLLSGLKAKESYFVRAYATSSLGTRYGTTVGFTTPAAFPWYLFVPAFGGPP